MTKKKTPGGGILLIDNVRQDRMLAASLLAGAGYGNCLEAESAQSARAVLKENNSIDLILLDVMLPDANGIDFCRELKLDPDLARIPIIMVTAAEDNAALEQAFLAGAADYIVKPFRRASLIARVEMTLRKAQAALQLSESERRYKLLFASNRDGLALVDPTDGRLIEVNSAWLDMFGYRLDELADLTVYSVSAEPEASFEAISLAASEGGGYVPLRWNRRKDGSLLPVEISSTALNWDGRPTMMICVRDISTKMKQDRLLADEAQVLEMLSSSMPLQELLESMCRMVEAQCGELSRCSILIVDQDGRCFRPGAAPSLSAAYAALVDGMAVDPMLSPCGAAAHFDRQVIVTDIATDSSCYNLRNAAEQLGLRACWSAPIHSKSRKVLGTFAIYNIEPLAPDARELKIIERTAYLAGIAIERRRDEDQMKLLTKVFEASNEAIMIADGNVNILHINEAFIKVTGYTLDEVRGHNPSMISSGRHGPEFYQKMWAELDAKNQWRGEIWNRRKNGEVYPEWLSISSIRDEAGRVINYIAIFADITESKVADEKIKHLAHHDFLTGLPNRALLNDLLAQAVAAAQRKRNKVAVLFIDLDRFKLVNDTLGHSVGDGLLQEVSARIKKSLRDSDTVCRQGGDEFIVILPDIGQATDAAYAAEKLIEAVSRPCLVMGHELRTSPSVGISIYPDDAENIEILVKYADTAMYHAKERGRNNFQFFTPSLNAHAMERKALGNALRQAIQNNELILYYQPQVDAVTGQLIGVEALIRWQHPALGFVMPNKFIPLAEESGLIIEIGDWVLREACHQNAAWQKAGLPPITLAINLAGQQFRQGDLPRRIAEVLSAEGLAPQWLELEVTESSIMENLAKVIDMLETLRGMGMSIVIDDFGTGFSSLAYLKRFPLHRLKIAQEFVRDISTNPDDWEIINAVIGMGKSLNLRVIAEGVQTQDQWSMLRERGCDELQGYLFGKPMPAAEFEVLLRGKID